MSQLRELVRGDGNLDTAFRALALAVFIAVATALVWTALVVQRDVLVSDSFMTEPETMNAVVNLRKEHHK